MSIKQIITKFLILVFVTSFITFTGCKNSGNNENMQAPGSNSVPSPPPPAVNSNASALPIFNIKNAAGNVINIKDAFKGKKVLVNLWATWCPPCRAEMPSLQTLYSSTDSSKVAFVFLSMDDDFSKAIQFMKDKRYTMPVYYPAQELPALFNVEGIPTTFIFDADGKIIHQQTGMGDYNSPEIKQLLQ
ncbi:MAG: TlpA family protein disulfide reductase [Hydrotalea sp. AMD]|uniref:TlpA family protein disulfide reductase n=1 Tax=Hydrotalea sp. AMD TaxID=2501297 RepID=UPI0009C044AE|nr:TlpA disulfide reductase family protein [Hydrotalea sp. AMD]RWZ88571.1 MAG: TlpA family protein disulfide reductase [Hydrotalea sp. AMD]